MVPGAGQPWPPVRVITGMTRPLGLFLGAMVMAFMPSLIMPRLIMPSLGPMIMRALGTAPAPAH